jgi:hypothetical protein
VGQLVAPLLFTAVADYSVPAAFLTIAALCALNLTALLWSLLTARGRRMLGDATRTTLSAVGVGDAGDDDDNASLLMNMEEF